MSDSIQPFVDRRALLMGGGLAGIALPALLSTPAQAAGPLTPQTRTWLKLVADLSGRTRVSIMRGDVWGLLPQADDLTTETFARNIYGYWSVLARKATVNPDGSVALKSKGWTFYLDPKTQAPTETLYNPYTKTTVSCPPMSGGSTQIYGAPQPAAAPAAPDVDLTERRLGDQAWLHLNRTSRFTAKDISWYKLELDLLSYGCKAADLDDAALTAIPNTFAHNLVAEWQTWMKMHGAPGHILFKGDGGYVATVADIPAPLSSAIDAKFPGTRADVAAW